jgi:hypothetical protein
MEGRRCGKKATGKPLTVPAEERCFMKSNLCSSHAISHQVACIIQGEHRSERLPVIKLERDRKALFYVFAGAEFSNPCSS